MRSFMRPPTALQPNDRVAVVAPAGCFDADAFHAGVAALQRRYEVVHAPDILERSGFLAGDDERRLRELQRAIDDPQAKAIVAVRGGYGCTRLLERIDLASIDRHPKLLVGFSDITALHALWARAGVRSLHAAMVATLARLEERLATRWLEALEGAVPVPLEGLTAYAPGRAQGPLLGGNLAVLAALIGTPYAPPVDGAILFLEDVGERPYRVDRMLTTLRQAGCLQRVAGVALGSFEGATPGPDGTPVEAVLRERLADCGVPVVAGIPAGHIQDNLELPLGAPTEIDAKRGTLRVLEAAVRAR